MDSTDLTSLTFGIFAHNGFKKVNVRASAFKMVSSKHAAAPHAYLENANTCSAAKSCGAIRMPLAIHRPRAC